MRLFLLMTALILGGSAANAADVQVRIHGVASAKGFILVEFCKEAEFLKHCARTAKKVAKTGDVNVTFENVPTGQWAVLAFHDENNNGLLDKNLIGIPTEGTAFSRDAKGHYGPPIFGDAVITVGNANLTIDMNLSY